MTIGIVGLGYVGLPLALAFAKHFDVVGYDIDAQRIAELQAGFDRTRETNAEELQAVQSKGGARHNSPQAPKKFFFTNNPNDLSAQGCSVFIVTVPTPVDTNKEPDLQYLIKATETVGALLLPAAAAPSAALPAAALPLVIYESTVYPGCTEEVCVPLLEKVSGLKLNEGFGVGYSPERINPGDKHRPLTAIVKVTSGSNATTAQRVGDLYATIIEAGVYRAPSLAVAEAAKAIENAQRDLNISFMNELALMFDHMKLDVHEVLAAAKTKWNFLPFQPGLVGGHCIGVDPHYLVHQARAKGYEPKIILSGREVNEKMGVFLAQKMIALLATAFSGQIRGKKVLVLGFAFKPNCADTRNTKVVDVYQTLLAAGLEVDVHDPWVDPRAVLQEFGIRIMDLPPSNADGTIDAYDGIVEAIAHDCFKPLSFKGLRTKI